MKGEIGNPGPKGTMGNRGPKGIKGERGAAGPRGQLGPNGRMGLRGPRGLKGNTGMRGPRGIDGPKGERGEKGDPGGPRGPRGKRGANGARGQRGPPGRSARNRLDVFKRKHARVRVSWSGSKFESAAIECGYGNDVIPMDINVDGRVDLGIVDIKNWFGVRIEKVNVTNTGKHVSVLTRVLNFTNDYLMISMLCPNDIITQADVVSMDESELLNESSLGPNSYRILRPTVSPESSTVNPSKSIVACLGPGESCFFRPQLKSGMGSRNSGRNSSLLLLADTIQVKNNCLEYASTWEEVQCGRLLRPPTFDEIVVNWAGVGNSSSSDEEEKEEESIRDHRQEKLEHQKEANLLKRRRLFVEALSNPVVRLQTPTCEELNKTVGCSNNYELIESVLRHLKLNGLYVTLDSDEFSCFFLEFLLSYVLRFLTCTGWEVDSLQETNGCTLVILTATTRLAFSYVTLPPDICSTFLKRTTLSGGVPGLSVNGHSIQQVIEAYTFSPRGS